VHSAALAAISFNQRTKSAFPLSNAILALDAMAGVYFAESCDKRHTGAAHSGRQSRHLGQALRLLKGEVNGACSGLK